MTIPTTASRLFRPGPALCAAASAALCLAAVPVSMMALATQAQAQAQTQAQTRGSATLDDAVNALRGIGTMQASFSQTDRKGQTVGGTMTLKRPGKIRFEYQKGVPLLLVSNGKSFTLIDYEVNQVQRWPIGNSPLGALLDPSRDVKKFGRLMPSADGVLSVEVRDPKKPEFGVITLIFTRNGSAPGGWQLTNWVALDAQNNRTTVRLSNHRYGVAVADSVFTYKDPRRATRRPR